MSGQVLIVDDDPALGEVLQRALRRRGYEVTLAPTADAARVAVVYQVPDYAVVDLKLPDESGLHVVRDLHVRFPALRIVVLTGYASIATAVEAIKLGATHYLVKPVDINALLEAWRRDAGVAEVPLAEVPLTVERLEWEHLQRVLTEHQGNISAAARSLRMHRRTLQRKLQKHPRSE